MVHALLQVDCTAMYVVSACTQPSFNDKNPSSGFVFISLDVFPCLKSSRSTVWRHLCWLQAVFQHRPALSELSS